MLLSVRHGTRDGRIHPVNAGERMKKEKQLLKRLTAAVVLVMVLSSGALAGKFSVSPVMATLAENKRIDSLTLKNESEQLVTIQAKLYLWSQDEKGVDSITPTEELSYMPRIFQLKPGEERSIRIGYSSKQAVVQEKAYRIYLTEQPQAITDPDEKSQLKVALSMGIPIFLSPKEIVRDKGAMTDASVAKGKVSYTVANSGNSRLVMKKTTATVFDIAGKELFSKDGGRQFVLVGMKKNFTLPLTKEECSKAVMISVAGELETGGLLKASGRVSAGSCSE